MTFRPVLAAVIFAAANLACALPGMAAERDGKRPALEVGSIPADELGKDVAGNKILISENHGKVVIISFWASWCEPCKQELPVLAGVVKRVGPEKLKVIAINFRDEAGPFKYVVDVLKDLPITMVRDATGKAARKYQVEAIPRMIVIDRDGKVAADHTGYSEAALPQFVEQLNELLKAKTT